jgi:hypothetical protein
VKLAGLGNQRHIVPGRSNRFRCGYSLSLSLSGRPASTTVLSGLPPILPFKWRKPHWIHPRRNEVLVGGGSLPPLLVGVKHKNDGSFASKYSLLASEPLFLDLAHRSLAPAIADACGDPAYRLRDGRMISSRSLRRCGRAVPSGRRALRHLLTARRQVMSRAKLLGSTPVTHTTSHHPADDKTASWWSIG